MLKLANTITRQVEVFSPLNPAHVKIYVCGPTVYARPHIGNARSAVVYDQLVRLLRHDFTRVTYVRNITDVDDKINAAAVASGVTIQQLTREITAQFHADMASLGVLRPDIEPRATSHIAGMITMIEQLISSGHAYEAQGHVLFAVASDHEYGALSRRSRDDMLAGARVEIAPYKRDAADFVLWKPAAATDDESSKFASPWGVGRPGWHIECSVMATTHLGHDFDIHGGGSDLMFPHHENEISQARCAHAGSHYARYWVHNGFLTVNGEKMSKSLGNFITVQDLLERGVKGEVIRFALLSTRYNEPLDWSEKLLSDAQKVLDKLYRKLSANAQPAMANAEMLEALRDNLNTPKALAILQTIDDAGQLQASANLLGLLQQPAQSWFQGEAADNDWIEAAIAKRNAAKKARDFATADAMRDELKQQGIVLEDSAQGTIWRRV